MHLLNACRLQPSCPRGSCLHNWHLQIMHSATPSSLVSLPQQQMHPLNISSMASQHGATAKRQELCH
jgi:hypothetical protein